LPRVPPELSPDRAPVTLYPQRRRTIVLAVVSAVFVVVGALAAADGAAIGWAAVGFFGLCLLVFLALLLPGAAYLRLDQEGFTICSLFRPGRVRWGDARSFRSYAVPGGTFVGFDLAGASAPLGRLVARSLSGVDGGLPDTYGLEAEELAGLLNVWRDRYA
jgi:hypothetical protein